MPERDGEAIGDPGRPKIGVALRAELAPIAGHDLEAVVQVVVESEFSFAGVGAGQTEGFGLIRANLTIEELLDSSRNFEAAHGLLPEWRPAQPVGGIDPVATPLIRPGVLAVQVHGKPPQLPGKMESKSFGTVIL